MDHKLELPYHYGEVVEERLKVLELKKKYNGFTLNEKIEIIQCECSIENDQSWNFHNNYDDSKNVLIAGRKSKWWTLNEQEIKKIQKVNLDKVILSLSEEIDRLKSLYA